MPAVIMMDLAVNRALLRIPLWFPPVLTMVGIPQARQDTISNFPAAAHP